MTIVEFLLARIAEDEEGAHRAAAVEGGDFAIAALPLPLMEGIRPGFPARVLAEYQAKRRLVELCASWAEQGERATGHDLVTAAVKAQGITAETVLRTLVPPYADHPDFDPAWRP